MRRLTAKIMTGYTVLHEFGCDGGKKSIANGGHKARPTDAVDIGPSWFYRELHGLMRIKAVTASAPIRVIRGQFVRGRMVKTVASICDP